MSCLNLVSVEIVSYTGKGEKADPGIQWDLLGSIGIQWDPMGSKKSCQRKEGISPKISDKGGKVNSEDRHMGEFQWILTSFDGF